MVIGTGLYAYTGLAVAQAVASPQGPTWELLFPFLGALIMAMGGAYMRGLSGSVKELRAEVKALQEAHAQAEKVAAHDQATAKAVAETVSEVKLIALSVQRRLDQLHVPSAFPGN